MAAPKGNNFALGLTTNGRPPKYATPDDILHVATQYFDYCKKKKEKATITGLALYLGFESRQSLFDYGKNEDFSYIINRIRMAVENSYELSGQVFDMFALKNMGWKDKTEQEIKMPQGLNINYNNQPGNEPLNDD
jgi:hypothetical protein